MLKQLGAAEIAAVNQSLEPLARMSDSPDLELMKNPLIKKMITDDGQSFFALRSKGGLRIFFEVSDQKINVFDIFHQRQVEQFRPMQRRA